MKSFREYVTEKLDLDDYEASAYRDRVGTGFRAEVTGPNGRTTYLGSTEWEKEDDATKAAEFYITLLNKPSSAMDREMHKYEKNNSDKIID